MTNASRAYIALTITTAFWGGNAVMGKLAVGHISPLTLSLLRWGFAFLLIIAISRRELLADRAKITRFWPLMMGYGAVGFAAFNAFLYTALNHTSAINCAIEQAGIPGIIFVANYLLFRTKVSLAQIAGFLLTLVGVAVTASHGSLQTLLSLSFNRGDGLMMFAILAYATYTVSLRFKPDVHWKSLMAVAAFGAFLASVPLAVSEPVRGTVIWPDATGWMAVAYTAIFPSLFSQVLYVKGVELIGPNRAGLFINAIPAFGILLSVIVLGERFEIFHLAAIMLVATGIVLAERGKPPA